MGCIAVNVPITIYEAGTFDQSFQWKTGEPAIEVDLTDYMAKMTIRAKLTDAAPLISIETADAIWEADGDSAIYLEDASTGQYRVYINDEDTTGLCAAHKDITGTYDLFLYSPAGESVLKQYGVCTLIASNVR